MLSHGLGVGNAPCQQLRSRSGPPAPTPRLQPPGRKLPNRASGAARSAGQSPPAAATYCRTRLVESRPHAKAPEGLAISDCLKAAPFPERKSRRKCRLFVSKIRDGAQNGHGFSIPDLTDRSWRRPLTDAFPTPYMRHRTEHTMEATSGTQDWDGSLNADRRTRNLIPEA